MKKIKSYNKKLPEDTVHLSGHVNLVPLNDSWKYSAQIEK